MANLGSEVSRLIEAKKKSDFDLIEGAYKRALDMFERVELEIDLDYRKEELSILKDVINEIYDDRHNFNLNYENVKDYFMPFALRVLG